MPTKTHSCNPAGSGAQYRLAQAVLSGTAVKTGMSKKVAREIVEKTPERMRSQYMKKNAKKGPIGSATGLLEDVTGYVTKPVNKAVGYIDKGIVRVLGNPERFQGPGGKKAAEQFVRLLESEGKKARVEKAWGEGWQVIVTNPKKVTKKEVTQAAAAYQSAQRVWGENNMITQRADIEYHKLQRAWDEQKAQEKARKGNPESDAASMYESFHGRASEEIATFEEEEHYHGHLAELGQLMELKVCTVTGLDATFSFDYQGKPEKGVILASNESGTSLYFVGGDQSIPLKDIRMDKEEYLKDSMVIGDAYFVSYFTEKDFDKFQPTIYEHELGEETGELPVLRYDRLNKRLYLDGGAYVIKKPLMRTSDGIEN